MLWLALATLLTPQSIADDERTLRDTLAELDRSRPESGPAVAAWEKRRFEAAWEYGVALARLADTRKDKETYRRVVAHFTDFIWRYDDYLAALQARIYVARAHQALEEWGPCFQNLKAARVLDKPERRKDPELVEIATRSHAAELRARVAHARGAEEALNAARAHLQQFRALADTEAFVAMRLEVARTLHALRRVGECEKTLEEVRGRHADGVLGRVALEMLASLVGRPEHVLAYAERLFEEHHFTEAAAWFGRAPRTPHVWYRLGMCYTSTRRLFEAAEALERAVASDHPERLDAALRLERVLAYLARTVGEASAKTRLSALREWMKKNLDLERAGPAALYSVADGFYAEGKFREALELYARIKPGQERYADALHSRGLCHFRLEEHLRAADTFRAYLELPSRVPRMAEAAADLACRSLLAAGKPEEALALTDREAPKDAAHVQGRLAHRVDALARLGRFDEARRTLEGMKEEANPAALRRALERLALGYEDALRRTGDAKLWGPYARVVVTLSEKSFQPLRGEKLLAAADALMLEGTAEAFGMAFDLYGQYLLAATLREDERTPVEYRRAQAALGSDRLAAAAALAAGLAARHPFNGSYAELRGDVAAAQAAMLVPGAARNQLLDDAIRLFDEQASARAHARDEHYFRLRLKYLTQLTKRDPQKAQDWILLFEKKNLGQWDEDRWGYQSKVQALKAKLAALLPARR
jgi:hypothetical protein